MIFLSTSATAAAKKSRRGYAKGLSVTMEFNSLENSEIGSMQFYYRREALEAMGEIGVLDYYRPGAEPRWALEMGAKPVSVIRSEEL
jgi:hypothetical protein